MFRFNVFFWMVLILCSCSYAVKDVRTNISLNKIQHIIVIYPENRSFDNLYGEFPNADGIANASIESKTQLDTNGMPLPHLPPVWIEGGKSKNGYQSDEKYPIDLANQPFKINDLGEGHQLSDKTRDLVHRFYQNQEQINKGKNNRFATLSDAGGLTMGYYDGARLPMWKYAKEYTLADHFFMGAFGGSFLNHMYLVCACAPKFDMAPEETRIKLDENSNLLRKPSSPRSALNGPPDYIADKSVTEDGFAVNTMQPSYQPSGIPPQNEEMNAYADIRKTPLPPQSIRTIGDALSEKDVSWKWYAEGWDLAKLDGMQSPELARKIIYAKDSINFQAHHQPFNYFKNFAPNTAERSKHLRDGDEFVKDIAEGTLPQVAFYKPSGKNNEHPGYADILSGDQHIADLIDRIQNSVLWDSTVIIVTYDENGGFWDHVPPPLGDRWGPATRVPAIIISPFAKRGFVDHTQYDTGSIIKFITKRFQLNPLLTVRPDAGDLSNSLN